MKIYNHGDILHCQGKSLISKGIRLFTGSTITHSAIYFLIDGVPFIMDAQKDGVNLRPFKEWMKKYNYDIIATPWIWAHNPYSRALQKSGVTGYDFRLFLFRYPSKIVKSIFTRKDVELKRVSKENEKLICSEFIAWVIGLENPQNYTPKDLFIFCTFEK